MGETTIRKEAGPLTKLFAGRTDNWAAAHELNKIHTACTSFDKAFTYLRSVRTEPALIESAQSKVEHEAANLAKQISPVTGALRRANALDANTAVLLRDMKYTALDMLAIITTKGIGINAKINKLEKYNIIIQEIKKKLLYGE